MAVPVISVENASTVVSNVEVANAVVAFQRQVSYHFAPHWNSGAKFLIHDPLSANIPDAWVLAILDDSDQAGALGYHDVTADNTPIMKIFARTDKLNGLSWTVTASHEYMETLADPRCDRCVQVNNTTFYAYENCDACEDDSFGYQIQITGSDGKKHNVLVSDFVLESWFDPSAPAPYDYKNHIVRPLQILTGGYIAYWTNSTGWKQKFAQEMPQPGRVHERFRLRKEKHHHHSKGSL